MKKLHLFKTVLLLFALMVGSSSVWADYESVYTFTIAKNSTNNAYASTYDVTISGMDWNVPGNQYADGQLRIGGKDFENTDRIITGKSAFTEAISKITFNHGGTSSDKLTVNSVKLIVASNSDFSTVVDQITLTPTIEKNTAGSFDFTPSLPSTQWASGCYYKILINCTCTDTKNRFLDVKSIVFYRTQAAIDLTTFEFGNTTPSVTLTKSGGDFVADFSQSVTVDPDDYTAYTYEWGTGSTFNLENAIIDSETGDITISLDANLDESKTIVVKAVGSATAKYNKPDDATYTLTVNPAPDGVGTPTFSKATGSYYYNTKVEIASINSTEIYYTTNGDTPSKSSTPYDDEEGVKITSNMTLKAIGYDGETASEVASIDYTLKAPEAPTFSVAAGAVAKGTVVTLTPGEGGSTVIYTTDGTTPSYSEDNGEIGTEVTINYGQTIKAITVDDGENESSVASATYTLTIPTGTVYYELVTDASTLNDGDKILIVNSDVTCTMNTASDKNNRPQVEVTKESDGTIKTLPETAQIITLEADGDNWYFNVGTDAYLYASSNSSNQLKTATYETVGNNGKAAISITGDIAEIIFQGSNSRNEIRYNSSSDLFSCYAHDNTQGDVKIYVQKSEEPTEVVTVSSHGWATYIPSYAVQFPANCAYVVTDVDGDKTEVETVTRVPARTPVLLKGEGEVTATILDEEVDAPATNLLSVGTGYAVDGKYSYVLAKNGENKAGFKQWTGAMSVLKDRVVLLLDDKLEARDFLFLDFEGETTGINAALMNNERMNNEVYNLNGQRVAQPTKGLYIVNGRKVVIK